MLALLHNNYTFQIAYESSHIQEKLSFLRCEHIVCMLFNSLIFG
ncbi:hypothetical protein APHCR_0313 [Anaplasma phagocytophilum str. CR1007]|nr:hypothetical protein APHCR_0313 [Anaplasma phagocytophilum str. CR1007]